MSEAALKLNLTNNAAPLLEEPTLQGEDAFLHQVMAFKYERICSKCQGIIGPGQRYEVMMSDGPDGRGASILCQECLEVEAKLAASYQESGQ